MADPSKASDGRRSDDGARLLAVIGAMLHEAGRRAENPLELDARLDVDLGLDSLTRVELLARLEDEFQVRLADRVIADAETPRDLLQSLRAARSATVGSSEFRAGLAGDVAAPSDDSMPITPVPADTPTLVDAVEWHVRQHPDRIHVHLFDEEGAVVPVTYGALFDGASRIANGLVRRGLAPGECVAIMLPTGREYLESFIAILLAGGTPVPIYPPARPKQIQEHFARHARILANAGARMLITFDQVKQVSRLLTVRVPGLEHLVTPADLAAEGTLDVRPALAPEQMAFLQYTSGSTGDPKGVVLTHANVLASLRSMARALRTTPDDVFVSWLPLYHDMGLIGAWLGALVVGFPLVLMSPLAFLARPERWLQAMSRFGGTISGGPNFAYELCHRRITDEAMEGLDLSAWRLAFNGAEPVLPQTMDRFCSRFGRWGFSASAMTPVYGLAEATLGVAFTPLERGPRVDRISREVLSRTCRAQPDSAGGALEVVSSGIAIPDFEVRVVDDAGREAADRMEGEVEFKGPGTTAGYYRNPEATRVLLHDGWLRSGDRGYLADGELYITGREKDVVIRAGRNIYPYALEQAVAELDGVRRGCVAVFGSLDPDSATERLVVLAEVRETEPQRLEALRAGIESLVVEYLDMPADEVVLAPPHTVLKTSSGKIRRAALAQRHAAGKLVSPSRAPWLQVLALAAGSLLPTLRRSVRRGGALAYAGWFALVLAVNVLWVWPAVVLLPGRRTRWWAARFAARSVLALGGIALKTSGPAPGRASVVVANHQSYLDGLALVAGLEEPATFVAKGELRSSFVARCFLDGLGVEYVERFDHARSVEDARRITDALDAGSPVVFFPEGTFHRMPGLLPFQLGAFEAAVSAGAQVCPVVIAGTRNVLRGDELFPRRHPISLRFLDAEPVAAASGEARWASAAGLCARVRARMLGAVAEPDLGSRNVLSKLASSRGSANGS